jgi:CRISPR/Cas system-associated exonuclease Cas4 (RecB family)
MSEVKEKRIWASELGGCPYRVWLRLNGVEGGYKPPSQLWWLSVGKGMEEDTLNQFINHPDSPIVRYDSQQEHLKTHICCDVFVSGKLDAIGYDKDGNPYVIEVKTMGRRIFEKFKRDGMVAVKYYMPQIQLYMHLTGIEKGILLARDRDSFMEFYTQNAPNPYAESEYRIHWVEVPYRESYIKKVLETWATWLKEAEFDAEHLKKPSGLCMFCEYADICNPDVKFRQLKNNTIYTDDLGIVDEMFEAYTTAEKWLQKFLEDKDEGDIIETEENVYVVRVRNGWKYLAKLK